MLNATFCRSAPGRHRGFTLVELMVVVVMVGVLAAIGISLFRQHIYSAKSIEAVSGIQAIRSAQERYRAENQTYLDVSSTLSTYYPMAKPGKTKMHWDQPGGNDAANWRRLNVGDIGPVQVGFACAAGTPSEAIPEPETDNKPTFPTPIESWYVIQARADTDADGVPALYVAASFNGEIYSENAGE